MSVTITMSHESVTTQSIDQSIQSNIDPISDWLIEYWAVSSQLSEWSITQSVTESASHWDQSFTSWLGHTLIVLWLCVTREYVNKVIVILLVVHVLLG